MLLLGLIENRLEALKRLRGTQDQTMRCGVIRIVYGENKDDEGRTPTERFLEDQIAIFEAAAKRRLEVLVEMQDEERRS